MSGADGQAARSAEKEQPPWLEPFFCWFCGQVKAPEQGRMYSCGGHWFLCLFALWHVACLQEDEDSAQLFLPKFLTGSGSVDYDLTMCASCVRALREEIGPPPRDAQQWVAEIDRWKDRFIAQACDLEAELIQYDEVEYFPACWFTRVPFQAPLRLVRGLPLLELFRRGWRWPWPVRIPAGLVEAAVCKHVTPAYEIAEEDKPLLEDFARHVRPWLLDPTERTIQLLARAIPAASDYAIYAHLKEVPRR